MSEPRFTPTWMTVAQAARGWNLSLRQARAVIRARELELGRRLRERGRIRTADFLAVPRGDTSAAPMIPDVAILWAKYEALEELVDRLMARIAAAENGGKRR